MSTNSTHPVHVRRLESDPIAAAEFAKPLLAAVRAGNISGDRELVKQSLYNYAAAIEGFDPHLAGDLEEAAGAL